ncbi:MAG: hypothetical protein NTY99_01390 [DPANN group archaeon]|nr:hypothetical protein [DPANN group archaeon]
MREKILKTPYESEEDKQSHMSDIKRELKDDLYGLALPLSCLVGTSVIADKIAMAPETPLAMKVFYYGGLIVTAALSAAYSYVVGGFAKHDYDFLQEAKEHPVQKVKRVKKVLRADTLDDKVQPNPELIGA